MNESKCSVKSCINKLSWGQGVSWIKQMCLHTLEGLQCFQKPLCQSCIQPCEDSRHHEGRQETPIGLGSPNMPVQQKRLMPLDQDSNRYITVPATILSTAWHLNNMLL
eukprot:3207336-Amphidinium_carterae.1